MAKLVRHRTGKKLQNGDTMPDNTTTTSVQEEPQVLALDKAKDMLEENRTYSGSIDFDMYRSWLKKQKKDGLLSDREFNRKMRRTGKAEDAIPSESKISLQKTGDGYLWMWDNPDVHEQAGKKAGIPDIEAKQPLGGRGIGGLTGSAYNEIYDEMIGIAGAVKGIPVPKKPVDPINATTQEEVEAPEPGTETPGTGIKTPGTEVPSGGGTQSPGQTNNATEGGTNEIKSSVPGGQSDGSKNEKKGTSATTYIEGESGPTDDQRAAADAKAEEERKAFLEKAGADDYKEFMGQPEGLFEGSSYQVANFFNQKMLEFYPQYFPEESRGFEDPDPIKFKGVGDDNEEKLYGENIKGTVTKTPLLNPKRPLIPQVETFSEAFAPPILTRDQYNLQGKNEEKSYDLYLRDLYNELYKGEEDKPLIWSVNFPLLPSLYDTVLDKINENRELKGLPSITQEDIDNRLLPEYKDKENAPSILRDTGFRELSKAAAVARNEVESLIKNRALSGSYNLKNPLYNHMIVDYLYHGLKNNNSDITKSINSILAVQGLTPLDIKNLKKDKDTLVNTLYKTVLGIEPPNFTPKNVPTTKTNTTPGQLTPADSADIDSLSRGFIPIETILGAVPPTTPYPDLNQHLNAGDSADVLSTVRRKQGGKIYQSEVFKKGGKVQKHQVGQILSGLVGKGVDALGGGVEDGSNNLISGVTDAISGMAKGSAGADGNTFTLTLPLEYKESIMEQLSGEEGTTVAPTTEQQPGKKDPSKFMKTLGSVGEGALSVLGSFLGKTGGTLQPRVTKHQGGDQILGPYSPKPGPYSTMAPGPYAYKDPRSSYEEYTPPFNPYNINIEYPKSTFKVNQNVGSGVASLKPRSDSLNTAGMYAARREPLPPVTPISERPGVQDPGIKILGDKERGLDPNRSMSTGDGKPDVRQGKKGGTDDGNKSEYPGFLEGAGSGLYTQDILNWWMGRPIKQEFPKAGLIQYEKGRSPNIIGLPEDVKRAYRRDMAQALGQATLSPNLGLYTQNVQARSNAIADATAQMNVQDAQMIAQQREASYQHSENERMKEAKVDEQNRQIREQNAMEAAKEQANRKVAERANMQRTIDNIYARQNQRMQEIAKMNGLVTQKVYESDMKDFRKDKIFAKNNLDKAMLNANIQDPDLISTIEDENLKAVAEQAYNEYTETLSKIKARNEKYAADYTDLLQQDLSKGTVFNTIQGLFRKPLQPATEKKKKGGKFATVEAAKVRSRGLLERESIKIDEQRRKRRKDEELALKKLALEREKMLRKMADDRYNRYLDRVHRIYNS